MDVLVVGCAPPPGGPAPWCAAPAGNASAPWPRAVPAGDGGGGVAVIETASRAAITGGDGVQWNRVDVPAQPMAAPGPA